MNYDYICLDWTAIFMINYLNCIAFDFYGFTTQNMLFIFNLHGLCDLCEELFPRIKPVNIINILVEFFFCDHDKS